jgi:hypothetical protein
MVLKVYTSIQFRRPGVLSIYNAEQFIHFPPLYVIFYIKYNRRTILDYFININLILDHINISDISYNLM